MPDFDLFDKTLNDLRSGSVKPLDINEIAFEQENTFLIKTKLPFISDDLAKQFSEKALDDFRRGDENPDLGNFMLNPFGKEDLLSRIRFDAPEYLLYKHKFDTILSDPDRKKSLKSLEQLVNRAGAEPTVLRAMPTLYPTSKNNQNKNFAVEGFAQCFDFSFKARKRRQEEQNFAVLASSGTKRSGSSVEEPLEKAPRFSYLKLAAELFERNQFSLQELEKVLPTHDMYLFLLSLLQNAPHLAEPHMSLFINPIILVSRFLIRESMKERLSTTPTLIFSEAFIEHHFQILHKLALNVLQQVEKMSYSDMTKSEKPWFAVQVLYELAYHSLVEDKSARAMQIIGDCLARLKKVYNRDEKLPKLPFEYMCTLTVDDIYNMAVILSPINSIAQIENDPKLKNVSFSTFCRESSQTILSLQKSLAFLTDHTHDLSFVMNADMVRCAELKSWRIGKVELALGFAAFEIMSALGDSVKAMLVRQSPQFEAYIRSTRSRFNDTTLAEYKHLSSQLEHLVNVCKSRLDLFKKKSGMEPTTLDDNYGQWFVSLTRIVQQPLFSALLARLDPQLRLYFVKAGVVQQRTPNLSKRDIESLADSRRELWLCKLINGALLQGVATSTPGSLLSLDFDATLEPTELSKNDGMAFFDHIVRELPQEMHQITQFELVQAVIANRFGDAKQYYLMHHAKHKAGFSKVPSTGQTPSDSHAQKEQLVGLLLEQPQFGAFLVNVMPAIEQALKVLEKLQNAHTGSADKVRAVWLDLLGNVETSFAGIEQLQIGPGTALLNQQIPPGMLWSWQTWCDIFTGIWTSGWKHDFVMALCQWEESFKLKMSFFVQLMMVGGTEMTSLLDFVFKFQSNRPVAAAAPGMPMAEFHQLIIPLFNKFFVKSTQLGIDLKTLLMVPRMSQHSATPQVAAFVDQLALIVIDIVALIFTPARSLELVKCKANAVLSLMAKANLGKLSLVLWTGLVAVTKVLIQSFLTGAESFRTSSLGASMAELGNVEPSLRIFEASMERFTLASQLTGVIGSNDARVTFMNTKLSADLFSVLLNFCHGMLDLSHQQIYSVDFAGMSSSSSRQANEESLEDKSSAVAVDPAGVSLAQSRPHWVTPVAHALLYEFELVLGENSEAFYRLFSEYARMVSRMTEQFTDWSIVSGSNMDTSDACVFARATFVSMTNWVADAIARERRSAYSSNNVTLQELFVTAPMVLSQFLVADAQKIELLETHCRYAVNFVWENANIVRILGELFKNKALFVDFLSGKNTDADTQEAWQLFQAGQVQWQVEGAFESSTDNVLEVLANAIDADKPIALTCNSWAIIYENLWNTAALEMCFGLFEQLQVPSSVLDSLQLHVKNLNNSQADFIKKKFFNHVLLVLEKIIYS